MKTIDGAGYSYNENGTTWIVQRVRFDDFGGINPATATFTIVRSYDNYADAHHYYEQFCSGLQDNFGICDNQNYSHATFYRIIEAREGAER